MHRFFLIVSIVVSCAKADRTPAPVSPGSATAAATTSTDIGDGFTREKLYDAAERDSILRANADAVIEEARRAGRSFDYFLGGETSTTIAWSAREGRVVVVFACC